VIRIATWNVNSIKVRIVNLLQWLRDNSPDILLLQETKCPGDAFPRLEIEALGYNIAEIGQRSYNGVAILSKHRLDVQQTALPGDGADAQARYIEAVAEIPSQSGGARKVVRVASIYQPNGNPVGTDKFTYKLAWMDRLRAHARKLLDNEEILVLGGDYNIAPTDIDVYDPIAWQNDALCRPESRAHYRALMHLGFTDAVRAFNPGAGVYTFWDYQAARWQRDEGLRIDHLLLSAQAADRLAGSGIDRAPRNRDKPSDHTPAWCELKL
jgi:exodeoxyribonuclease-3